jgi:prevent-host-death family protein
MENSWQLQEAKAKLSEVMRLAQASPQYITMRGEDKAVVISKEYYDSLTHKHLSLVELMQNSLLKGLNLSIKRDTSLSRDVDL